MSEDLDRLLRRTAAEPSQPLDVTGLLRRARRRRRRGELLVGITLVLIVVGILGVMLPQRSPTVLLDDRDSEPAVPPLATTPTDTPTATATTPTATPTTTAASTPTTDPGPSYESAVAPAPIEGREGAVSVWTGQEVLVWGGSLSAEMGAHPDQVEAGELHLDDDVAPIPIGSVSFADGAAYDPAVDDWRPIAAAPFTGSYGDRAVWTGQRMLVWSAEQTRLAAYDPTADEWQVLSAPPEPARERPAVTLVWTGEEAILWGGFYHQPELPAFGVAFDPTTGGWRELPAAPVLPRDGHTATWTGEEMVVWGGANIGGTYGEELGGAAYDPEPDAWRTLPLAPTGGREGHAAVWSGSEVLVWGGELLEGLAYDPAADGWRVLPAAPVRSLDAVAVWTGEAMLAWGGRVDAGATDAGLYDPATDTWRELPNSSLSDRCRAATAWTGTALFVWSGQRDCGTSLRLPPDDGALLAPALAVTPAPEPQPSEGLPEACQVLDEGERRVSTSGVVASTLGPTLLEGMGVFVTVGPLVAVRSDDPQFETPWYAVSAVVTRREGGLMGTATWLSPDDVAVYAGGPSPEEFEAWRADPARVPEATHLYSANDLARQVSVWSLTDTEASGEALSRDCAEQLAAS